MSNPTPSVEAMFTGEHRELPPDGQRRHEPRLTEEEPGHGHDDHQHDHVEQAEPAFAATSRHPVHLPALIIPHGDRKVRQLDTTCPGRAGVVEAISVPTRPEETPVPERGGRAPGFARRNAVALGVAAVVLAGSGLVAVQMLNSDRTGVGPAGGGRATSAFATGAGDEG